MKQTNGNPNAGGKVEDTSYNIMDRNGHEIHVFDFPHGKVAFTFERYPERITVVISGAELVIDTPWWRELLKTILIKLPPDPRPVNITVERPNSTEFVIEKVFEQEENAQTIAPRMARRSCNGER